MARVRLSPDRLEAYLVLEVGETIAPIEAWLMIARAGVSQGLDGKAVMALATMVGPAEQLVASGEPATHGQDAQVHYFFRTEPGSLAPAIGPGGQADYRSLNLIECVAAGQLIATRVPPLVGKDGFTVRGERVAARRPRNRLLRAGEGCALAADGNAVIALMPGSPSLENGVVAVRRNYRVNGSVGLSTGHVHFDGDLEIAGDVELQMEVSATGRVVVAGSVMGARVSAGRDLVVHGKVLAGAAVSCEGDMRVGFAEFSTLHAGGALTVRDDMVHCEASGMGRVRVGGNVVGGTVVTGVKLTCRALGSPVGVPTMVVVDPEAPVRKELEAIGRERGELRLVLAHLSDEIREFRARLRPGETQGRVVEALRERLDTFMRLNAEDRRLVNSEEELRASVRREFLPVEAQEMIHPEVEVQLGETARLAEPQEAS